MLVYRSQTRRFATRPQLESVGREAARLSRHVHAPPDDVLALLIECAAVASGMVDALAPSSDDSSPTTTTIEQVPLAAARAVAACHAGDTRGVHAALATTGATIGYLLANGIPAAFERPVREERTGAPFPATEYLQAAKVIAAARGEPAVCVGQRGGGVAAAALVAAALERESVDVSFCTLRPRGHPAARAVKIGTALRSRWQREPAARFILVADGQDASLTSSASLACALAGAGIAGERIHVVANTASGTSPSPDDLDHLANCWQAEAIDDINAGRWRKRIRLVPPWPAVHPEHEQVKFVIRRAGKVRWMKFAGYGTAGRAVLERAYRVAAAGWSPVPDPQPGGWMSVPAVEGLPMRSEMVTTAFLEHVARYIAWVGASSAPQTALVESLIEMTRHNVAAALGAEAVAAVDAVIPAACDGAATYLDARMKPHEWVQTETSWLKIDSAEHADDRFFPGPCDIAWDLAAACEEWHLDARGQRFLIDRYGHAARDRRINERLPFYRVAYLSFCVGYSAIAVRELGDTDDGLRFRSDLARYRRRLDASLQAIRGV